MNRRDAARVDAAGLAAAVGGWSLVAAISVGALAAIPAHAQMYLPDPRIELDDTTNVFFGSTKDADGRFLADVAVQVSGDQATYVMVTDDAGRFRIRVPRTLPLKSLRVNCTKPGWVVIGTKRRPPPKGATSPVQFDCVLAQQRSTGT